MIKDITTIHNPNVGVTFRAVILGLLLIPINTYFIMANHLLFWSTLPTTLSLIYNVIITLTILIIINFLIQRFFPNFALKQGELLVVYIILSLSSAISGHDMMQTLVPTIPYGFQYATPENEWEQLFWKYLPRWLTLDNLSRLEDFYRGGNTLYTKAHLEYWLRPIFWWTLFLTVLIWTLICLDILLRKQWEERERLPYPILQLPLEMTRSKSRLFKSNMMWLGFAIAGGINLINGIHAFVPAFVEIPVRKAEIGQYFTESPWNVVGWTPLYILPFAVGLGFLMPSDMSFSVWFFYLFWKVQRVVVKALGVNTATGFMDSHGSIAYDGQQAFGAFLALTVFAIIGARRHIVAIVKSLGKPQPYERKEPMTYRWAVIGFVVGFVFLMSFSYTGGMAVWTILVYFLIYYLLAISVSRIRAEVGAPTHELFLANPRQFFTSVFGSRVLSPGSLTMMALYITFNRGYRAHPMPHALEAFKLSGESGINSRRLVPVMVLATVVGILAAFWAYLAVSHSAVAVVGDGGLAFRAYSSLQRWLFKPSETNVGGIIAMCSGFVFTGLLWWLRRLFPLWPFHPAGYAVASGSLTFGWLWFSILVSWAAKVIILKVGGIGLYRKALPLFLGLILGEYVVGGAWVIIRLVSGFPAYSFYR